MEEFNVKIVGLTSLLQNRDSFMYDDNISLKKDRKESYDEYQERIWRDKAHTKDGFVIFPGEWIKQLLIASQKLTAVPIKPPNVSSAKATMKQNIIAGVRIMDDPVITQRNKPVTIENLAYLKCTVKPSRGKVLSIRPMITPPWEVVIPITITDPVVKKKDIIECLKWGGAYNGVGDWRPQNGGTYGMFQVK